MNPSSKRSILVSVVLVVALVALFGFPVQRTYAQEDVGAVVVHASCQVDPTVTGLEVPIQGAAILVLTPSGNAITHCTLTVPEEFAPEEVIRITGVLCPTLAGSTTDSTLLITPGGKAVLSCEVTSS